MKIIPCTYSSTGSFRVTNYKHNKILTSSTKPSKITYLYPKQTNCFYLNQKKQNFTGIASLFKKIVRPSASGKTFSNQETEKEDYLRYIETTTDSPQVVKDRLHLLLNDENSRDGFIEALTSDPTKSQEIVSLLIRKMGGKSKFLEFYYEKDGYVASYEKYLEKKISKRKIN